MLFLLGLLASSPTVFSWETPVKEMHSFLFQDGSYPEIAIYETLFAPGQRVFQEEAVRLKVLNIVMPRPQTDVLNSYSNSISVKRGVTFMKEHRDAFLRAKYQFGVPSAAPAAILYVETLYGKLRLRQYPTLDTLLSLAALADGPFRDSLLTKTYEDAQGYSPSEKWKKKSEWNQRMEEIGIFWKNELKSFLIFGAKANWSPDFLASVRGSWVGAFGHNQMLPSTALSKVSRFGMFDPWNWDDSIYVTAAELHSKGWRSDSQNSIFQYNQAKWYVDSVWSLYTKLKDVDLENWAGANRKEDEVMANPADDILYDMQDLRSGFYEQHL